MAAPANRSEGILDIVGPIVMTFSYFLNGIVIILERRLDIHSSVLLFYFWFVHFLLSIPALVEDVENYVDTDSSDGSGTRNRFFFEVLWRNGFETR